LRPPTWPNAGHLTGFLTLSATSVVTAALTAGSSSLLTQQFYGNLQILGSLIVNLLSGVFTIAFLTDLEAGEVFALTATVTLLKKTLSVSQFKCLASRGALLF
jgi:hypothetical protein